MQSNLLCVHLRPSTSSCNPRSPVNAVLHHLCGGRSLSARPSASNDDEAMRSNLEVEILLVEAVAAASAVTPGDHGKGTGNRVNVSGLVDGVVREGGVSGVDLRTISKPNKNEILSEGRTAG